MLENMFTHSYGRNLFNTRTGDRAARGPTSLLMRAAEAGQKQRPETEISSSSSQPNASKRIAKHSWQDYRGRYHPLVRKER
ncbi:hypothetical protein Q5P01_012750 [Channa striata]|uniref:Uncharacterized protein n=1 Tax=Channa striata TaxID=64152 RepID=A0AA88MQC3_CHASR|nr:hypothetical protein Q5P01_012750 [Channa striata]